MSLKAKVEAIIYAAEEPVTLEQMSALLKDTVLADIAAAKEKAALEAAEAAASEQAENRSESAEIPELATDNNASPEPGPLMPEGSGAQAQNAEENPPAVAQATPEATSDQTQPLAETPEASSSGEDTTATSATVAESAPVAETSEPDAASAPEEQAPVAEQPESASANTVSSDATPTGESASAEPSPAEPAPAESASVSAPETTSRKRAPKKTEQEIAEDKAVRTRLREILAELVTDYATEERGMEIRQVAGGFRMATKPEHHDVVRAFAKSLKPPIRLSLAALETLAVISYKQPVTGPEISDIRGVESGGVLGTLLERKLITTAGRKQVIGRPMQYKTSKEFLLRFGLNDISELPSMEEFSQLAADGIEITPSEPKESMSLFEPGAKPAEPATEADSEAAGQSEAPVSDSQSSETQSVEAQSAEPESAESAEPDSSQAEASSTEPSEAPAQPQEASAEPDSQPSESEPNNVPETEHPIGR